MANKGYESMARINIEQSWWSDPRRNALGRKLGSQALADGVMVQAWMLAQDHWKKERQLVPKHLFDMLEGALEILGANLAEVRGDLVYIRGSSTSLDWINQSRESGKIGGRISAQRPRDEKGRLTAKESKGPPSESKGPPKDDQTSVSSSSSNTNTRVPIGTPLWKSYEEELQKQYGIQAIRSVKKNTICKGLVEEFGLEKAKQLVLVFLKDKEPFVVNSAYDIGLLQSQLQKYLSRLTKAPIEASLNFTDSTEVTHA